MLFATLDPSTRYARINDEKILFTDTVGFIKDLPEELEKAFASTLEQAKNADVILNVASASADFASQFVVTDGFLDKMGAYGKRIYVLNKCDLAEQICPEKYVHISAKCGDGLEKLKQIIFSELYSNRKND